MIVYYNDSWNFESNNSFIRCNKKIIDLNKIEPRKVIDILLFEYELNNAEAVIIDSVPKKYTKADTLLLLAVGSNHQYVYCEKENKKCDITFSYNFPVVIEKNMIDIFLKYIDEITKAQLIALGEKGDFIRVSIEDEEKFRKFKKRVNPLVKRNDKDFKISYSYDLDSVLNRWQKYCLHKFNQIYSKQILDVYKKIYSQEGFYTKTYLCNGEIVAQGVIFISDYSKTIYYCIFAWDERFKSKSPGIYAYSKIICKCFEEGYKFSFCYGRQKYKLDLIREFI